MKLPVEREISRGMIAKTLALTLRAIREDAWLLRMHLFRLFLLLIIVWFLVLTQWDDMGVGAPGLDFFRSVTYLDFCFISLAGIGFFASAITEEKEEMTLGLLRMAGIGPMALLAGKLIPRLLGAVLLLSVQFPFTLLAITLGGVSLAKLRLNDKLLGFLLIEALLTNVGGLLTLISSVPNIIIGNAADITFVTFFLTAGPYVAVATAV